MGIRIAIPKTGIDPIFFSAHEHTNRNDGGRITWSVAGFITYMASHLKLFSPLIHMPLIYWSGHKKMLFFY